MEQVETRLYCQPAAVGREGFVLQLVWCRLAGMRSLVAAVRLAARGHVKAFGVRPVYGFVRRLPRGVESGVELAPETPLPAASPHLAAEVRGKMGGVDDDGVFVMEADWMPEGVVAVGMGTPTALPAAPLSLTPLPAGTQASPQVREGRANMGGVE